MFRKKEENDDIKLDPDELAIVESEKLKRIAQIKQTKRIVALKEELAALEGHNGKVAKLDEPTPAAQVAARPAPIPAPENGNGNGNGKHELAKNFGALDIGTTDTGLYFFRDNPKIMYDTTQLIKEIAKRKNVSLFDKPANGNGKAHESTDDEHKEKKKPMIALSLLKGKGEAPIYRHVLNETINLQAANLMPQNEKLLFVDPKVVELDNKATPKMKKVVELMSKPVEKKPIDPKLLIGIGIMVVIVAIALVIINNQIFEPAAAKQRAYDLQVLKNGGNATGIAKPSGGLFNFELPNPLAPCPTCEGGSQYKGK